VTVPDTGVHAPETVPVPVVPAGTAKTRAVWTFADQALSSLTNFVLAIVVARAVSASDFGAFSLALVTFAFVVGLGRGMIGDPFVVRFTDAPRRIRRRATGQATGAALVFGALAGVVCALAAIFLTGHARYALLALALSLPGLVLQETWRHTFFAAGRPAAATVNDGVWAVVQFGLLGVLLAADVKSVFVITIAWGLSALVAAIVGILQTSIVPRPFSALAWYHETRDLNVRMALDFALNMGAVNLAIFLVGGIAGLVGVGALRAAQVLLGPLNLLFAGLSAFVLPALAREAASGRRLVRSALRASGATGAVASTWVVILLVLPTAVGDQILGESWAGAHSVMLGSGLVSIAVSFVLGASLGLKALRRADQMLRVTFLQSPLMLGLGALGAWQWGAVGAAYGFAIAQIFGLLICWTIFLRADAAPATGPRRAPSPYASSPPGRPTRRP
jgi:O-antigen/teichoic acid export membrane protein